MDVSINYPWGTHGQLESFGYDFGRAPNGSGHQRPDGSYEGWWQIHIDEDLRQFASMGIRAVRFAIMVNGLTYGVDRDVPRRRRPASGVPWDFTPVRLDDRFVEDFRALVRAFGRFNAGGPPRLTLMPVLIGFDFAAEPPPPTPGQPDLREFDDNGRVPVHFVAGCRADALSGGGAAVGASSRESKQELFLHHVLGRLLDEFAPRAPLASLRSCIHSWDLCGEPEYVAAPSGATAFDPRRPVAHHDMLRYLRRGIEIVRRHGFTPTVGFQLAATERAWRAHLGDHLSQFHYYAESWETLPEVKDPDDCALLGEVATNTLTPFDAAFYRKLRRAPTRPVELIERLEWFEYVGYREVFLWSAGRVAPRERHSWTAREQDQVADFTLRHHRKLGLSVRR